MLDLKMAHSNPGGIRKASRYHRLDDIPTNTFTPQTYQIQLLDAALKRNTLLCLGCSQSKVFLALMVAKELASSTRHSLNCDRQVTFYLTDSEKEVDGLFQTLPHHTDLQIGCCPLHLLEGDSLNEGTTNGTVFQEWSHLIESSNILVCYSPVFLAAIQNNYVRLKDVNLLIFDDCHRAAEVVNHPYAEIVAHVRTIPFKSQPHILGVTASIAGTECDDPSKLQETVVSMEKNMHAYAETSMLLLSERFGCRPRESVIKCIEYEYDTEQLSLRATLEDLLEQSYYFFSNCHISVSAEVDNRDPSEIPEQVLSQCLNVLTVLGTWCTSSISEYFVMQLEKILKCEKNEIHKRFLRCVITSLRLLIKVFEKNFHPDYDVDELLEYTTPKVRELVTVLRNYKPELDFVIISNGDNYNGDDDFSDLSDDDDDSSMSGSDDDENNGGPSNKKSHKPVHIAVKRTADGGHEHVLSFTEEEEKNLCGVVFVENRYIAFGLNKVIEEVCSWDENLCFVKSCHITGQGLRGTNGKQKIGRNFKRQEEALRKFRTQECNLVIATLELEEGVDIPKCNLVIRFDPPKDYRSYTLSKGRARARDALYVILLDQQNYDHFESSLKIFKGIEQVLLGERTHQQAITHNSDEESDDEIDNDIDIDEKDLLPPYCTVPGSPSSPQVTMQGSIALINRYCAKLPSDAFTHLTPQCRIQKVTGEPTRYLAFLRLPINSPIKEELKGPVMNTKKLAKMAVALKMCEILHTAGELDENLFPVGKEMFLYEEEEEWADEEDLTGQARPGTTKRKQYYVKKVADALVQSLPMPGKPCFLYLINLQLTGPITDEQNTRGRVIYAPEDTVQTLGILLSQQIPQVPNFPVYTRSGEVTVSIDLQQINLTYSDSEISRLLKFHHFVFSGVLHLEKDPMEFNPENADCGLIVVPLNGKEQLEIDWPFVDKVIKFLDIKKQAGFSRKNPEEPFAFCIDDFKDAVVMPSYRNIDQPQHFYVAEILNDLNPRSPFPSPELYKTFQDYYTTKYGLVITSTEQPLLDVDHTSARLNLLTPRYMNQKGVALPTSSAETKRARRENLQQKQILVPELCDIHVFPASLWRKTVCLPAILYRANNLLLAEELRCKISKETGIGVEKLPKYFSFPQLDFGFETSPEKLKEAELNSSKKSDQPSPNDKCVSEKFDKKSHVEENNFCTRSAGSSSVKVKSEEHNVQPVINQEKWETPQIEDEAVLERDMKITDDKIDSSSSDSDSGIASSGSDTNIGTSSGSLSRASPDILASTITSIVSSDSKTKKTLDRLDTEIAKQEKDVSDDTRGVDLNPAPWCSSHGYICNITPQGSSISNTCGNDNQCNIIYTNEVAKPVSNSFVNGQPDGRNITATTSSVIQTDHLFCVHTTKLLSASTSRVSSSSASFMDTSPNITSLDQDICEVSPITATYNVSTAASVSVNTYCSDASDSAASGLSGAKINAAVVMPLLTCSAMTPSSMPSPSYATSSFCLSHSGLAPQNDLSAETSEVGDTIYRRPTIKHVSSASETPLSPTLLSPKSVPEKRSTLYSNIINCVSTPLSPAASSEAQFQEEIANRNLSISIGELHDNQGCEFVESSDPRLALITEIHPAEASEKTVCDTCTNHEPTSYQSNVAPVFDHPCVHQPSAQKASTNISTSTKQKNSGVAHQHLDSTINKSNFSMTNDQPVTNGHVFERNKECTKKIKVNAQNNTNNVYVTSKSPPSKGSSSENRGCDNSAIIMNTFGQELSDLDIDLIIPQAYTSDTFHSSESQWSASSRESENPKKVFSMGNISSKIKCENFNNHREFSKSHLNDHHAEVIDENLDTKYSHKVDADVIKFSFSTSSAEDGNTKNAIVDTWVSEPKESCEEIKNLANNIESSNIKHNDATFAKSSTVLSEETSNNQSSAVKPSEETSNNQSSAVKPSEETSNNQSSAVKPSEETSNNHSSAVKPSEETSNNHSSAVKPSEETSNNQSSAVKPSEETSNNQSSAVKPSEETSNNHSSAVKPSEETSNNQSSAVKPSESRYAEFDIGVWSKRSLASGKLHHGESSASTHLGKLTHIESQSLTVVDATTDNMSSSLLSSSSVTSSDSQQHMSLDEDRNLQTFVGPSPCLIMQALTMSNANDFFSLERLETIGDSFLKYAITVYLYCSYPGIHEGKLSYLRSKQVSNYNLYRLGRRKCLAECMVSTKFEPYENWLPPGFIINEDRRRGPVPKVVIVTPELRVANTSRSFYIDESIDAVKRDQALQFNKELEWIQQSQEADRLDDLEEPGPTTLIPYSLQRHHGLPDKSVADCVEAFIGCYLTTCGRKAALMFMSWLGLKVLPKKNKRALTEGPQKEHFLDKANLFKVSEQEFDELRCPPSPMFSTTPENVAQLEHLLEGFDVLEEKINYKFRDRSYLLQAFTHASYHYNTITDCYQRVEFLGDAILDYVITRHLYEDSQKYSPGILTDLRSALVNNNIFAALAVKWGFHKYFKAISPSLFQVIDKFVKRQKEKKEDDIDIDEEYRELSMEELEPEEGNEDDDEEEEVEMEIPKALGDIFESVAGAIYLDSGMSLDTVWAVYYRMMKPHIDKYLKSIPKSPVRELLETEPETAKFERPERTMNGKVRVTVNVVGKGAFSGVGRNYRIAKSAAAKKALRSIRILNQNLTG